MANSSEWFAEVENSQSAPPDWIAALSARSGFEPRSPFPEASVLRQDEPTPAASEEDAEQDRLARAFAEGEAAGRSAAEAEAKEELDRQRELRLAFRAFDQAAMDSLAAELAATVEHLCAQVIAESAVDRDDLIERCKAATARIGEAASACKLYLHPDDIELAGEAALKGWKIEPDTALERGSLLLEGSDGTVRDGPAEWRRAIAEAVRG